MYITSLHWTVFLSLFSLIQIIFLTKHWFYDILGNLQCCDLLGILLLLFYYHLIVFSFQLTLNFELFCNWIFFPTVAIIPTMLSSLIYVFVQCSSVRCIKIASLFQINIPFVLIIIHTHIHTYLTWNWFFNDLFLLFSTTFFNYCLVVHAKATFHSQPNRTQPTPTDFFLWATL